VLELFWTLTRGFKVILQPDEERRSLDGAQSDGGPSPGSWCPVPEQIARHGVTHLQCTPSLAGALVLAPESLEALRGLRTLLLGGEALPVSLAEQLRRALRGELLNMYGPTESTVWSTVQRVDDVRGPIPIGRPIANTEIYLLDRNLQPVPVGVPGELFIGGDGVARGYLNRPALTQEKFIAHPFRPEPGARLYRTGDLARYRTDGVLEFLGRGDNQVKLRGHRIELGEIESALRRHSGVGEAVVVAREPTPGDQRLLAYLVAKGGPAPSAPELRRFLHEKLPDYMVPSTFVALDRLPLTPNGKVDRRALPEPAELWPRLEAAYVAPRTAPELALAKIWQELLRVEKVGLHDNFFDLGGHSLLVVQAQAKLRDALGIELPVVRLFQHPTISALTKFLGGRKDEPSLSDARARARRQQEAFAQRREQEVGV
jgi:acyl-CoA synthetase (AMP-forming)/AMP-acid ligase II